MEPKRKKVPQSDLNPFPVDEITEEIKYIGLFTGVSVEIFDTETIKSIYENGCFGKGSFSRSIPEILQPSKYTTTKEHKYLHRIESMANKLHSLEGSGGGGGDGGGGGGVEKSNTVEEEEEDDDDFLEVVPMAENCGPGDEQMDTVVTKIIRNPFQIKESLVLSLEEAFFLHFSLKCLEIRNFENSALTTEELWTSFCEIKKNFIICFVGYQYFRSKNWVVKGGLQFGGDFREFSLQSISQSNKLNISPLFLQFSIKKDHATITHRTLSQFRMMQFISQ